MEVRTGPRASTGAGYGGTASVGPMKRRPLRPNSHLAVFLIAHAFVAAPLLTTKGHFLAPLAPPSALAP